MPNNPLTQNEREALQDAAMRATGSPLTPKKVNAKDFEAGWLAAREFYAIKPDPNPRLREAMKAALKEIENLRNELNSGHPWSESVFPAIVSRLTQIQEALNYTRSRVAREPSQERVEAGAKALEALENKDAFLGYESSSENKARVVLAATQHPDPRDADELAFLDKSYKPLNPPDPNPRLPKMEVDERWARRFHEVYEFLAPQFGYDTRDESKGAWERVPKKNRELMTHVVGVIRAEMFSEEIAELTGKMANEVSRAERRCWMEGWECARFRDGSPEDTARVQQEAREAWEMARNDAQLPASPAPTEEMVEAGAKFQGEPHPPPTAAPIPSRHFPLEPKQPIVGDEVRLLRAMVEHKNLMFFDRLESMGYVERYPSGYQITQEGRAVLTAALQEKQ
jgi:hypothetical protein